jgi:hypothetical protein
LTRPIVGVAVGDWSDDDLRSHARARASPPRQQPAGGQPERTAGLGDGTRDPPEVAS